jgi:tricorn protease-like protein
MGYHCVFKTADYSSASAPLETMWHFLSLLFLDPVTLTVFIFNFLQTNYAEPFLTH